MKRIMTILLISSLVLASPVSAGIFDWFKELPLLAIFVQAPTITAGDDGTITVSDSRVGRKGGYESYVASIWVDNEFLCCDNIPTDGLICKKIKPSQGYHTINAYVVGYNSASGLQPCSVSPNYPFDIVTKEGIQLTRSSDNVGRTYSFDDETIDWYVSEESAPSHETFPDVTEEPDWDYTTTTTQYLTQMYHHLK